MRRIEGDGVTLAVLDEGEGPAVLLLHGFPDSSRLWRNQVPALVDAGFRVIAPDLRGFGESDKPEAVEDYAITRSLADVVAILDALGVDRARVVGHDWGAGLAWVVAGLAPERVDRLVALSVGHPNTQRDPTIEERRRAWYMLFFQFPGVAEEVLARRLEALPRVDGRRARPRPLPRTRATGCSSTGRSGSTSCCLSTSAARTSQGEGAARFGPRVRAQTAAGWGSGRTITVSATSMISSTGRSARDACSRIFSGLDAW